MFSLLYKNFFGDFQGMKAKKRSRPLRWDRSVNIVPVVPPGLAQRARFNVLSYAAFCLRRALLRLAYSAKNLSPFRSPSKVHSVLLFPPQSHRLRLSWGKWVKLTHSFSSVLKNVSTYFFVCQLFFTNNFNFLFGRRHGAAARDIPAIGVRIGARLRGGEVRARAQYLPVVIKYFIFLTKIRINVKILTPKKLPTGLPVAEELPRISYECRRCKGLTESLRQKEGAF